MVKKALLIIMLLFVMLSATGCQTVQGVGGDIRWLAGARDEPSSSRRSSSSSGRSYSSSRRNYSDTRDNYSGTRDNYYGAREDY